MSLARAVMRVARHDTKKEKATCIVTEVVRAYILWLLTSIMHQSGALGEHNARGKAFFHATLSLLSAAEEKKIAAASEE